MPIPKPLNGEPLISLNQAVRFLPGYRGADRLHPATLTRWILSGVKAPSGQRVKLEAVRYGHRWLTSEAALARFATALTPSHDASDPSTPVRSPANGRSNSERAAAALIRAGA